jgi:hypothetical protein
VLERSPPLTHIQPLNLCHKPKTFNCHNPELKAANGSLERLQTTFAIHQELSAVRSKRIVRLPRSPTTMFYWPHLLVKMVQNRWPSNSSFEPDDHITKNQCASSTLILKNNSVRTLTHTARFDWLNNSTQDTITECQTVNWSLTRVITNWYLILEIVCVALRINSITKKRSTDTIVRTVFLEERNI